MIDAENIVALLHKHGFPSSSLIDHMTIDLDLNSFWVAAAVLRAGYQPR